MSAREYLEDFILLIFILPVIAFIGVVIVIVGKLLDLVRFATRWIK
jgi:hypothetical protein